MATTTTAAMALTATRDDTAALLSSSPAATSSRSAWAFSNAWSSWALTSAYVATRLATSSYSDFRAFFLASTIWDTRARRCSVVCCLAPASVSLGSVVCCLAPASVPLSTFSTSVRASPTRPVANVWNSTTSGSSTSSASFFCASSRAACSVCLASPSWTSLTISSYFFDRSARPFCTIGVASSRRRAQAALSAVSLISANATAPLVNTTMRSLAKSWNLCSRSWSVGFGLAVLSPLSAPFVAAASWTARDATAIRMTLRVYIGRRWAKVTLVDPF